MSLILDALKKSEAERQRGQAPGLFVEQAPLSRARREGVPAWAWALAALLVALLAVFGWREWSRAAGDGEAAATESTQSPAPDAVPREPPAEAPIETPPEVATTAPASSAVAPTQPPPAAVSRPPATPSPATPARPRPAPALAPAPVPAAVAAPAGADTLPRLADLSAGERAALPSLKLTMHVYADDPAARFVILDGRRLGEGSLLGDTVVVREIRRDGVVLEAQGRAVLLPRP